MNSNIQNIKDIWNNRLNTLVEIEEYEMAKKTKDLIDKIDTFISLRDEIEDKDLYKRMEETLIKMCQI
jgi:hypothetical protein